MNAGECADWFSEFPGEEKDIVPEAIWEKFECSHKKCCKKYKKPGKKQCKSCPKR